MADSGATCYAITWRMPDLGRYVVGLLRNLTESTGLRLDSTWAG